MKTKFIIPEVQLNNWRVEHFEVSKQDAKIFNVRQSFCFGGGRFIESGKYMKLVRDENNIVMSDTPTEVREFSYFVCMAEGYILISGLGLGLLVHKLLQKKTVKMITVIEKEADVIDLVLPHIKNKRLTVLCGDVFDWKIGKNIMYDYIWHDIWDTISEENLPEISKLKRKFGRHHREYQGCWCEEECKTLRRK